MDFKNILGKLTLLEGTMAKAEKNPTGSEFTGHWKGSDAGTPGKQLVGDSVSHSGSLSVNMNQMNKWKVDQDNVQRYDTIMSNKGKFQTLDTRPYEEYLNEFGIFYTKTVTGLGENLLKDLHKGPTPKTKEEELAEEYQKFLDEENLGVAEKRPSRKGARPARDMGKAGEPSKRYNTIAESVDDLLTSFRNGWRKIEGTDFYGPEYKKTIASYYGLMRTALMADDVDYFWRCYSEFSSLHPDEFVDFLDECGLGSIDEIESLLSIEESCSANVLNENGTGDYEVVWTDRDYNTRRKVFKSDPLGAPDNARAKAEAFSKRLEKQHGADQHGTIRGKVSVKAVDESRGHKVIADKLKDIERRNTPTDDEAYKAHIERMKAQQKEYLKKNPNSIYKQVDEYGANQPQGTAGQKMVQTAMPSTQDVANQAGNNPQKAAAVAQATQTIKSASGATAPNDVIAKALDAVSKGQQVSPQDMKTLEPVLKNVAAAGQDPTLANDYKTLAQKARIFQQTNK